MVVEDTGKMEHQELVKFIEAHKKANSRKDDEVRRFNYLDLRDRFCLLTVGEDRFSEGCWSYNINEYYLSRHDFETIIQSLIKQKTADLDFKSAHVHDRSSHEHAAPKESYRHESVRIGYIGGRLKLEGELLQIEKLRFVPMGKGKQWNQREAPTTTHIEEMMGSVAKYLSGN
jgi:hypothetical protein